MGWSLLGCAGEWERHYMEATVAALGLAGHRRFGLSPKGAADREGVLFLDIGANVGSHSLFVSAAGYRYITHGIYDTNTYGVG